MLYDAIFKTLLSFLNSKVMQKLQDWKKEAMSSELLLSGVAMDISLN